MQRSAWRCTASQWQNQKQITISLTSPLFVLLCHTFTKEQDGNCGRASMGRSRKRKWGLQHDTLILTDLYPCNSIHPYIAKEGSTQTLFCIQRAMLLGNVRVRCCTHLQSNLFSECWVGICECAGHTNAHSNPCRERHCQSIEGWVGGSSVLSHLTSASQA